MRRIIFLCLFFTVALMPAHAQNTGIFEPARCPMPIPGDAVVDCGYLTVPERHENPDGQQIELAVAIVRATDPNPRPDPVVYLEGGPGGSALWGLDGWLEFELLKSRDLILFDQRGTGYSIPGLFCDAYEYGFDPETVETVEYETACAEALSADGIDLGAYNSAQSAQDVALLVEALGYDQVNLYGISYGTRLALTVLRDQPQIVRAAILDSPYPPNIDGYEMQALNGFNAIEAMFAACAANVSCALAFPDLRDRFYAWVESGDTVLSDFGDSSEFVDGYEIVSVLFDVLYDSAAIPFVPLALENILNGDGFLFSDLVSGVYADDPAEQERYDALYELTDSLAMEQLGMDDYDQFLDYFESASEDELLELYDAALSEASDEDYAEVLRLHLGFDTAAELDAYLETVGDEVYDRLFDNVVSSLALGWIDVSDADGAFNSVTCVEELPFNDRQEAELYGLRLPATLRDSLMEGVYAQYDSCAIWGVEPAAAFENDPVQSDLPVLVLAGQFDPITPPLFAEAAAKSLTNAQVVIVPGAGHSVIDAGDCPASLTVAFFDDPAAPLDTSCVSALTVDWVLE
jgi:pimeloyl-ACP methyl ester carboxylesterase